MDRRKKISGKWKKRKDRLLKEKRKLENNAGSKQQEQTWQSWEMGIGCALGQIAEAGEEEGRGSQGQNKKEVEKEGACMGEAKGVQEMEVKGGKGKASYQQRWTDSRHAGLKPTLGSEGTAGACGVRAQPNLLA